MKKHLLSFVSSVCALLFASSAFGATPWAVWTNFEGLTSDAPLAPTFAFTRNNIDASKWKMTLAGNASVDADNNLKTGDGAGSYIDFFSDVNLGISHNPITFVMKVKNVAATAAKTTSSATGGRPVLFAMGTATGGGIGEMTKNDTTQTAKVCGIWNKVRSGNSFSDNNNTADRLAQTDVSTVLVFDTTGDLACKIVTESAVVSLGNRSGLKGSNFSIDKIHFGNAAGLTSDGLDYTLEKIALFKGAVTADELKAFVNDSEFDVTMIDADASVTQVASGATLTLSDGVTLDLGGATFGEEKATIALAEGATSATVHIYTADKVKLNDLPEGVTLVETRPSATLTWDNTQTTWSADTQWVFGDTTTKFQEGDTIVFDLTEDKEITFNGSFKPEAIVVKGAKLTIKAPGHTTTVHTLTTLADGGSLDVSDTGGSTYLAAVDVGEGCTLFANLDQMPGGISGSGKWCYNTSDSVTYASGMANLTIWVKKGNTFQAQQNANASLPASLSLELEGGARFYFPAGGTIASPIKVLSSATPENPAQLDGSYYGGTTPLTGAITLEGTLKLITGTTNCGNAYNISGAITGPGGLIVDDSQSQLVELTGVNTFTGGLTVNRNVTIDHDAVGRGDITVTAETLTVTNGGTLTILSGKTLAGAGTIAGNVEFADGAILDASQVLSVTGVSSAGTAKIKLAEAPADGTTAVKVLSATSVELPFAATIVYGEDETELTGWVTTSESDGLYIIKADTIKETTLTPPAEGELTWAGAWGENAPGESEAATLIVTQDITLDIGTTELPVGAVTIKKGETATTTPTLTLVNVANFAPSGILLEGVNLKFAGTTEANATTEIDYSIMGEGAVTITSGSVKFTHAGNTFDGGLTIAAKATVVRNANDVLETIVISGSGTYAMSSFDEVSTKNFNHIGWTGTVTVSTGTTTVIRDMSAETMNTWGNANSTIAFDGVKGYFADNEQSVSVGTIEIAAGGLIVSNGYSTTSVVKFKKLTGAGDITLSDANVGPRILFASVEDFTGNINTGGASNKKGLRIGIGVEELDGDSTAYGTILIGANTTVKLVPQQTLTTIRGLTLNGTLDLTAEEGLSTISGALAGDGKVKLGEGRSLKVTGDVADTVVFTTDVEGMIVTSTTDDTGTTYSLAESKVYVAEVNGTKYETLKAAVNAVNEGTDTEVPEIVLTADAEGEGIIISKAVTIDFGGYTYTVNLRSFAGSANTQTQCFQIRKSAGDVTFKNGQIIADDSAYTDVTGTGYGAQSASGKLLKMLVQNYANLTLEGMTLDATTAGATHVGYALSNNAGTVVINGSTIKARMGAAEGDTAYAFDLYYDAVYYPEGVSVTVDSASKITGNIEITGEPMVAGKTFALELNTAPTGIVMNEGAEQAAITKPAGLTIAAPEGYEWKDGTTLVKKQTIVPPTPATGGTVVIEATDADTAQEIVNGLTIEPITVDGTTILLKATLEGDGTEGNPFTAQLAFADETAAAAVLTPEVGVADDSTAEPIAITADGVQLTIAKSVEGLWYGYKTGATLAEVMAAEINTDVAFIKGDGQELTLPKVTGAQFFKVVVLPYNPNK